MNRTNRTARAAIALTLIAAVALLSACGSADSSDTSSAEDQIKAVTTEYTAAQAARDEAKLRSVSCKAQVDREISEFDAESNPTKITVDEIANRWTVTRPPQRSP